MNQLQEARFQTLNDQYSVASFTELPGGEIHCVCDDGDEALIRKDGTLTWKGIVEEDPLPPQGLE